jgi:hypothetical protein
MPVIEQLLRALGNRRFFALEAGRAKYGATRPGMGADMPPTMTFFGARHHVGKRMFWRLGNAGLITSLPPSACRAAGQLEGAAVRRVQPGQHIEKRSSYRHRLNVQIHTWPRSILMPTSLSACWAAKARKHRDNSEWFHSCPFS